jgi:hypothetical protein
VDASTGGYIGQDEGVGSDAGVVAYVDRAEDGGADADHDAVPDGGMAAAALGVVPPAAAGERDAVIDRDIVTDDRGFTDHDAGPVVDEEAPPDGRARMDLDAGQRPYHLGERAREKRHAASVQPVEQPMCPQCPDARVEHDLASPHPIQRRVTPPGGAQIFEHACPTSVRYEHG